MYKITKKPIGGYRDIDTPRKQINLPAHPTNLKRPRGRFKFVETGVLKPHPKFLL